jgi:deoxyribose-phosphate aldolase
MMEKFTRLTEMLAQAITNEKSKPFDRTAILKNILGMMDLTTLEGSDHENKIAGLCRKAFSLAGTDLGVRSTAAVCVYPVFVAYAKNMLQETGVKVACVAGGFPSGQMPLHLRVAETAWAVEQGADEIDMVISRGRMLSGDEDFIFQEVDQHKKACGKAHLKVILETGELPDPYLIQKASEIAIAAGGDFIKTSTGKIQPAATLEASWIMLNVIREHFEKTGIRIGFKPAGGIATAEDAIDYYLLVKNLLGTEWLTPTLFRFGASRLFDHVIQALSDVD